MDAGGGGDAYLCGGLAGRHMAGLQRGVSWPPVVRKYVKREVEKEGLKMLKSERAVLSEKDIFFVNL